MRIFVTGGTGALGRHLVPGLVAAGHEVTATTRTPGKVAQLREAGAEPVVLDGLDRKAVIAAVGHSAPGIYNVVDDDPAPVAEWLPYLAKVAGAKPPLRLPAWLGRLLAGEFVVAQMTTSRGSSNQKARKELGWEPQYPSWREGFRAWVRG
jgi:nucleoside-diphosphate-sugar epimerase